MRYIDYVKEHAIEVANLGISTWLAAKSKSPVRVTAGKIVLVIFCQILFLFPLRG